jgi:hypothetical protein
MTRTFERTEHAAVQIVQSIGARGLGLRMNDYRKSIFLNRFEKRIHHRIIQLHVEMAGEERDRAQAELMDTALEFSLGRFGLVDR